MYVILTGRAGVEEVQSDHFRSYVVYIAARRKIATNVFIVLMNENKRSQSFVRLQVEVSSEA